MLDRDNTASDVWADTAYRSATNLALLEHRGKQFTAAQKTDLRRLVIGS